MSRYQRLVLQMLSRLQRTICRTARNVSWSTADPVARTCLAGVGSRSIQFVALISDEVARGHSRHAVSAAQDQLRS